jgi:hypothetical protein
MNRVTLPLAIQSHTAWASKRGSMWQVAPDHSAQETTLMIPCTWCTMRSSADHSQGSTMLLTGGPNVGVGCDHPLRPACRAAGIQNHGASLDGNVWQFCGLPSRKLIIRQRPDATGCGDWCQHGICQSIERQCRWLAIVDKVFQLGSRSVERQWDRHSTCPPHAPLRRHPRKSRCHQERYARFSKVVAASEQRARHSRRCIQRIVIGEGSLRIDDSYPCITPRA